MKFFFFLLLMQLLSDTQICLFKDHLLSLENLLKPRPLTYPIWNIYIYEGVTPALRKNKSSTLIILLWYV